MVDTITFAHTEKPNRYHYCLEGLLSLLKYVENVKVGVHKKKLIASVVLLEMFAKALKVCRHNETRYICAETQQLSVLLG